MAREKTCAMDCKCRKDDDPTPCHTVTPTRKELTEELARVKAHLSAMDDNYEEAMTELSLRAEKLADCKEFCETLKSRNRNLEGR